MAGKNFKDQVDYGWGLTLNLTGKAPAISKRIFSTYQDLLTFVNDIDDSAIDGLVLTVVDDDENNGVYFIQRVASENTNANIIKLYTAEQVQPLIERLGNLEIAIDENEEIVANALESFYKTLEDFEDKLENVNFSIYPEDKVLTKKEGVLASNLELKYNPTMKRMLLLGNSDNNSFWDYFDSQYEAGNISEEEYNLFQEIRRTIGIKYTYNSDGNVTSFDENSVGIDMTPFLKDDALIKVELITASEENPIVYEGSDYRNGTKFLKFVWRIQNESGETEESETLIELSEIGKTYEYDSETINVDNDVISVKTNSSDKNQLKIDDGLLIDEIESDAIITTKKITVADGPLSNLLINSGITEIEAGTNLQNLLFNLFCKELWPSSFSYQNATISGKNTIKVDVIKSSEYAIPGSSASFIIKQNPLQGYTSTTNKVSGFTYGYSTENDNEKDSDKTYIEEDWNVVKNSTNYELSASLNDIDMVKAPKNDPLEIEITAMVGLGENKCEWWSYGKTEYTANINKIPSYYACSNIGNTKEDLKSNEISEQSVTFSDSASKTGSSIIIGVYPIYSNEKDLLEVTMKTLQASNVVTMLNIPSEESLNKQFIFEFPAVNAISSMEVQELPNKYLVYTNVSDSSLTTSANTSIGYWTKTLTLTSPSESETARFTVEYPASATLNNVTKKNDLSGNYETITTYNTESIKRGNDSYTRFYLTGPVSGGGDFKLNFNDAPGYKTVTDEWTEETFNKEYSDEIEYKRLTTTSSYGIVNRRITLSKKLSE